VIQTIYRKEGIGGFYHGARFNLYSGLASGLIFIIYEELAERMREKLKEY
jgi:hypothetical protein